MSIKYVWTDVYC